MNLQEIVARLKLKYKIVNGVIYAIVEKRDDLSYLTYRPAFNKEINEIKKKKKQPVHPPRPPRSPYEEE